MTDKTQPRDWSEVVSKIAHTAYPGDTWMYRGANLKNDILAILQEFDAQKQPYCPNCAPDEQGITPVEMERYNYMGAMADIDHLIETIAEILTGVDENGEPFVTQENMLLRFRRLTRYMEKNYRKQWNKYTSKKTAPTANPLEYRIGSMTFYGRTAERLRAAKQTEEPIECKKRYSVPLTIGEIYDVAGNGCFVDQAKLLSIAAESDHFIVQGVVLPVTYKVHRDRILSKHTPKPVEHIYSDTEIINELETWQDEPISPKHFCIRGQIIRQQMKELGKGYCKL